MLQAKFSIHEDQAVFLNNCKNYGFKDKSEMIRKALNMLIKERELQSLRQSAQLYAEAYAADKELQAITDAALQGWPE